MAVNEGLDWSSKEAKELARRLGVGDVDEGPLLRDRVAQLVADDLREESLAAIAGVSHVVGFRMLALIPGRSRSLLRRLAASHFLDLEHLPLGRFRASELLEFHQVGPHTVADIVLAAYKLKDGIPDPEDTSRSLPERLAIPPGLSTREMRYRIGSAVLDFFPRTPLSQLFPSVPLSIPIERLSLFQRSRTVLSEWTEEAQVEGLVADVVVLTAGDIVGLRSAGVATVGDICLALDGLEDDMTAAVPPDGYEEPQSQTSLDAFNAVRGMIKLLSDRERRIYALRKVRQRKPTLEEIGKELACTRERVRQIESKVHTKIATAVFDVQDLLNWPATSEFLGWLTATERLGFPPRPVPDWDVVDENSIDEIAEYAVLVALNLQEHRGYVAPAAAWSSLHEKLASIKETSGMTVAMIRRRLEMFVSPLESEFFASLLTDAGLRLGTDGMIEAKPQTQQQAVLQFFERSGRPLTREEVKEGTGLSDGQARGILQRRGVFSWVGKGVFAPTSWGLPVYEGTEAALRDALAARGGSAPMDEVIEDVTKRFGCTDGSCRTYLYGSVLFERQGDVVTLATGSDRPIEAGNPARQKRVYADLRDGLIWAVDIDREVLRGSGRGVPPSIAAGLGATRLGDTILEAPGGALCIKRVGVGIQMSSMRKVIEALGAEEGDRILLRVPRGGDYRWDLVRRKEHDPIACCLSMVGQAPNGAWPQVLSLACWQSDESLWQETLWDRSDCAILELLALPPANPRGTILDLESLDRLLFDHDLTRAEIARHASLPVYVFNEDAGQGQARLTSVQTTLVLRGLEQLTERTAEDLHRALFRV